GLFQTNAAMMDICLWPCLVSPVLAKPSPSAFNCSFAQVLNDACDVKTSQLLAQTIRGDDLCIKITQYEYEKGKLSTIWKIADQWKMISLGRGFYEFQFVSFEDMRLAWSLGTINLKPGVLRLSKWTNAFNPYIVFKLVNWLKPSEAKVNNRGNKIITMKKEAANMQYIPKKEGQCLTYTFAEDDIVLGDILIDDPVLQQVATNDVADVAFVKQAVGKPFTLVNIAVSMANEFDASTRAIPDTKQNIVILPDDEFDEVVQANLQVIKQVWTTMEKGEKPSTLLFLKAKRRR
ncbi:putative NBS resistance protein, partial [Trifolium pratense]